jgi:hypothetical protein
VGVVFLGAAGWSQSSKPADDADAAKMDLAKGTASPKPDRRPSRAGPRTLSSSYASSLWEYWVNLTIPAGSSLDLDSDLDFSYSDNVRVTIRSSDSGDLSDVVLDAYWTVPQAPFFNLADVVKGDTFYYRNVGGATFNTYGSRFRLRIINNGATAVTLRQVLMFTLSLYG